MKADPLAALVVYFAGLSLVAIGGANATIPAMHDFAVSRMGWLDDREFARFYALASAAPGPNVLIVTLIGFKAAGLPGALAATLAMCGPSSLLCFAVARLWDRAERSPWRALAERALAPVTVGLVLAAAFTLTAASGTDWQKLLITAAATAAVLFGRFNPLWALGAATALGFLWPG